MKQSHGKLWIKRLVWSYFFLLIFEGALRKWILPAAANPLLLIRDPVVLAAYFVAWRCGLFPRNVFVGVAAIIAVVSLVVGLMVSSESPAIAIYGFRTNFLQLPFIFLIPKVFDARDVERVGYWTLILSIPMAALMVLQFLSPPQSWINAGLNDKDQIASALGRIRPPGTFSFVTGPVFFYPMVSAFLLYTQFSKRYASWLIAAATAATLCAIAVSGSRSLLASIGVVFLLSFACSLVFRPALALRWIGVLAVLGVAAFFLSNLSFFSTGVDVFSTRVSNASVSEGGSAGFLTRATSGFTAFIPQIYEAPFFGNGLGLGTNVGAAMLVDKTKAIWFEDEWGRHILESGPLLGFSFILYRVLLTCWIGAVALRHTAQRDPLPVLLFGACVLTLLTGIISQPTVLGFAVFLSGICLAAIRVSMETRVLPPQTLTESISVKPEVKAALIS